MAAQLTPDSPARAGVSQEQLDRTSRLIESEIESGKLGAAAILVARRGRIVLHRGFGRLSTAADSQAVQADSVFLLASITKPVTASSLMLLVERGLVSLRDPVQRYLPEFQGGERDKVQVRDLLRHTSGLPDMLPENLELRAPVRAARQAKIARFSSADPATQVVCVILTNRPYAVDDGRFLRLISNAVAASVE